jgi:hypothetical protein
VAANAADEVLVFAPEFNRSRVLVQHGFAIAGRTIVTRVIGKESHPRLGLVLILPEARRESVRVPREEGRRRLSKHELRDIQVSDLGQASKIIVAKNSTVVEGRSRDHQICFQV